jgi:hypothetical protein
MIGLTACAIFLAVGCFLLGGFYGGYVARKNRPKCICSQLENDINVTGNAFVQVSRIPPQDVRLIRYGANETENRIVPED